MRVLREADGDPLAADRWPRKPPRERATPPRLVSKTAGSLRWHLTDPIARSLIGTAPQELLVFVIRSRPLELPAHEPAERQTKVSPLGVRNALR